MAKILASKATKAKKSPKTTKAPRYLQLAGQLRESILAGDFGDGEQFPTETSLCAQFDVSRFTVREALRRLEAEGLIQRKRGSGTTVQPPAARGGALHQPLSSVSDILQYARGSAVVYRPAGRGPLPGDIAEEIARSTDGIWTVFHGLRQQGYGEKPIAATTAYFHERLGDAINRLDLNASPRTLFTQIEQIAGVSASKVTQDIQATAASAELAEKLEVEIGSPVLRVLRCYVDASGEIYQISLSHHPGDRFAYSMNIDVDR
ncbi:GntR family transcriptional regulator [Altererythrobacter sp. GH1-8]|uniref:GntR family transcriptional regulator n=1 Tax=Altererythrobacter sp. GH1-8 TaxID=3349333 RepID=UPI00374CA8BE